MKLPNYYSKTAMIPPRPKSKDAATPTTLEWNPDDVAAFWYACAALEAVVDAVGLGAIESKPLDCVQTDCAAADALARQVASTAVSIAAVHPALEL